jgi:hypothetical protein
MSAGDLCPAPLSAESLLASVDLFIHEARGPHPPLPNRKPRFPPGGAFAFVVSNRVSANILAVSPLHDRDGVIRFPHRRKISSTLIRNTVVPTATPTTLGSCLAIEGVKSPKTRSRYERHPLGHSKAERTAVGRSIFPADGTGRK